jgi:BirA family transcriptional regulator, biotin operon repressor / biotin---[acetyl-CoA-carboxylase] ligase
MIIGDHLIELDSVESTNKTAAELIGLSKAVHGTVILAREQTGGRGQRGRVWRTEPGLDLALSLVLLPSKLRAEDQFSLSKMAALAVYDTIRVLVSGEVRIKWPNDVLVERRKMAGILIECDLAGDRVRTAVVGIGLNVNSNAFDEDLAASSLQLETGLNMDLKAVRERLCTALQRRYAQWETGGNSLDADYSQALWAKGRWAEMLLDGTPESLRPMDVDRHGRLLVEHEGGKVAAYGLDRLRFAPR